MRTTLLLSGLLLAAALTGCSSSEQTANTATGTHAGQRGQSGPSDYRRA
ncbi:MAG: hypothetical protein IPH75_06440 [bacterium]|nr:hypothetical protein [bacterium]